MARSIKVIVIGLFLWFTPPLLLGAIYGWSHVFSQEAVFFSKAAMVTFGGAYAVLPYVAQSAVEQYGWLNPGQLKDGLGLAETTPGPLIMVVQFIGFLGGWSKGENIGSPLLGGVMGALITTWVTFLPCFIWIFLGAPYIEKLRNYKKLNNILSGITAATVGVVLNLSVYFGLNVLFPGDGRLDLFALFLAAVAFWGLQKFKWDVTIVVLVGVIAGVVWSFLKG